MFFPEHIFRPDAAEMGALRQFCMNEGVFVGYRSVGDNVIRFQPLLLILQAEMNKALELLDKGLTSLENEEANSGCASK